MGRLFAQHHVAILILGKLIEEVLLRESLAVLSLGAKLLRNGEGGHDGGMVDGVDLHLI